MGNQSPTILNTEEDLNREDVKSDLERHPLFILLKNMFEARRKATLTPTTENCFSIITFLRIVKDALVKYKNVVLSERLHRDIETLLTRSDNIDDGPPPDRYFSLINRAARYMGKIMDIIQLNTPAPKLKKWSLAAYLSLWERNPEEYAKMMEASLKQKEKEKSVGDRADSKSPRP